MPEKIPRQTLRVVTYNIHKGVLGLGPAKRLEIHNLSRAVALFDADIICLQEVHDSHALHAEYFTQWPDQSQADFLAPDGYNAVYRTNAFTRHGEHGNALLTRWPVVRHQHADVSDHRFEQRGILHVELLVQGTPLHVIVVHFGLISASRRRQAITVRQFVAKEIPVNHALLVAGDFNEWGTQVDRTLAEIDLLAPRSHACATFPARLPLGQLDRIYSRGLTRLSQQVPHGSHGASWHRMSDHLPLQAEFAL